MADERAGMSVAFHTTAFHQHDPILRRFAEVVTASGRSSYSAPRTIQN